MKKVILLLAIILFAKVCSFANTTIAVLPYKVSYEGRIPKKYTTEQLESLKKQESVNYQVTMINYLTKMNSKRKNADLNVIVLSQSEITALFAKNEINESKMDTLSNAELAKLLGVTHVVRGSASRSFIMSDELSLGILVAGTATGQPLPNPTSRINIINALEDVSNNSIVLSRMYVRSTSVTKSDEQSLRDTFRKSSRKMFKKLR